ncbi:MULTISPECIES: Ig-like domain-containing protein [Methanobacterium]|uniref:SbsA Ig-like domain-containing protein n=1 Tax=Methanobacterium bryantii TaxID=2161 RepID=A0A2A2H1T2_METBR|nr:MULTISPECIES: Ig-like domain-containing protein [Methanobacterium]OEC84319.1 hypothetical protein A9507_02780 [Methanobacterium sp. A39]PAV03280.1 hypothetical protein ASJ80_04570 [Methanobacterium bryantii]
MYATSLEPVSAADVTSNSICCQNYTNPIYLQLVRTGENTYTAYFIDSKWNAITNLPANITFTVGKVLYNVTTVNGMANFTVPIVSNLSKIITASFNHMNTSMPINSPISSLDNISDLLIYGRGSGTIIISPTITATSTKNKATGVSRTNAAAVRFSKNILKSVNWSKIYVKNLKTGKKCKITTWVSVNHLYIKTNSKRAAYTWYQVYIPASAVKDSTGNKLAKSYTWKFKTGK